MEFNEKLQDLRKKKGLTQEELGKILYVSRTAISKWESGRGYPNIESLKGIAQYFGITVDELLSSDELLSVAEENSKLRENNLLDLMFGLIDLCTIILFFLPFFAQKVDGIIYEVPLFKLTEKELYLKIIYFIVVISNVCFGAFELIFINCQNSIWITNKRRITIIINAIGVILFSISLQPYAAILVFVFLFIKVLSLIKI